MVAVVSAFALCADAPNSSLSSEVDHEQRSSALARIPRGRKVAHAIQKALVFRVAGTAEYLESFGFRAPRLMAFAVIGTEFLGGILIGLGLLMPLGAALVASTMLVAAFTDHRGKGWFITGSGGEFVATNAVVAIALASAGGGRYSLDRLLSPRHVRDCVGWRRSRRGLCGSNSRSLAALSPGTRQRRSPSAVAESARLEDAAVKPSQPALTTSSHPEKSRGCPRCESRSIPSMIRPCSL